MAHLRMIESWVGASGSLLPPLLKKMGHTFTFVTRKLEHYQQAHGTDQHPVSYHASEVLVTETNDSSDLIEFLRPYQFDGVITVCDYYIETVQRSYCRVRGYLGDFVQTESGLYAQLARFTCFVGCLHSRRA